MATRGDLRALAHELRHAPTRRLPIEVAERVQHVIVRLEQLAATPLLDVTAADAAYAAGHQLLGELASILA